MPLFIHNTRGFSLIETLVIGAITSVIILGTLKLYHITSQSAKVSSTDFAEEELINSIKEGLSNVGDCTLNLDYRNLQGGNNQQARGNLPQLRKDEGDGIYATYNGHSFNAYDTEDIVLLEEGKTFKNNLHIVKMEMSGNQILNIFSGRAVERFFTVYYTKEHLGKFRTLEGRPCISSDLRGCYFQQYKVMYELAQFIGLPHYSVTTCSFLYCTKGVCCYKVDEIDETLPLDDPGPVGKGRAAIGCSGPSDIAKSGATALGYEAGADNNDGFLNTLIGYKAGKYSKGNRNTFLGYLTSCNVTTSITFTCQNNTTGSSNVFIGAESGQRNRTGERNVYLGRYAGDDAKGSRNTFIGSQVAQKNKGDGNVFIGTIAGERSIGGNDNVFLGFGAGRGGSILDDPIINPDAPILQNVGDSNVFIGSSAGIDNGISSADTPDPVNPEGSHNIYIGGNRYASVGPPPHPNDFNFFNRTPPPPDYAGITGGGRYQLNIGNLILGRLPNPDNALPNLETYMQNAPNIPSGTDEGIVINGDLIVKGMRQRIPQPPLLPDPVKGVIRCGNSNPKPDDCGFTLHVKHHEAPENFVLFDHDHKDGYARSPHYNQSPYHDPISSKMFKKNIKSFKNFDKALKDIVDTPLFTYEYKKDHPKKNRMGVISEELPKHLQMKGLDSRPTPSRGQALRGNDRHPHKTRHPRENGEPESKDTPSMPDWPSVYGTIWASIKILFTQLQNLKTNLLDELKKIKKQFTDIAKIVTGNKKLLSSLNKQAQEAEQVSQVNQEKNLKQKKELIEIENIIKKNQAELKASRQELHQMKDLIQEGI